MDSKLKQEELDWIVPMGSSLSIDQFCDKINSDWNSQYPILEYCISWFVSFELDTKNCNSSFETTLDTLYLTSPSENCMVLICAKYLQLPRVFLLVCSLTYRLIQFREFQPFLYRNRKRVGYVKSIPHTKHFDSI